MDVVYLIVASVVAVGFAAISVFCYALGHFHGQRVRWNNTHGMMPMPPEMPKIIGDLSTAFDRDEPPTDEQMISVMTGFDTGARP